jgi:hypothetical protein
MAVSWAAAAKFQEIRQPWRDNHGLLFAAGPPWTGTRIRTKWDTEKSLAQYRELLTL